MAGFVHVVLISGIARACRMRCRPAFPARLVLPATLLRGRDRMGHHRLMSEPAGVPQRRQRRRATARQGPPRTPEPPGSAAGSADSGSPAHGTPAAPSPDAGSLAPEKPAGAAAAPGAQRQAKPARRARRQPDNAERGLRDLVGAGRSQLGVSGALRGRDVNRPTPEDLAEAEQTVTIVRRNWQPAGTEK